MTRRTVMKWIGIGTVTWLALVWTFNAFLRALV